MSESKITRQTLIPVGLMASIIAGVITIVWFTANLNSKTGLCCKQAEANTEKIENLPSKEMYNSMDKKIDNLGTTMNLILQTLVNEKNISIKPKN